MSDYAISKEWSALCDAGRLQFQKEGFTVDAQLDGRMSRLYIVTPVFSGSNFIPESVRRCLRGKGFHALDRRLDVRLVIDEGHHQVLLLLQATARMADDFDRVLRDFFELAHEWREILDEHGNEDLVYVPIK